MSAGPQACGQRLDLGIRTGTQLVLADQGKLAASPFHFTVRVDAAAKAAQETLREADFLEKPAAGQLFQHLQELGRRDDVEVRSSNRSQARGRFQGLANKRGQN